MPLTIGQIVNNRYRILTLLGQGGMGAVYQAHDLSLNRVCAVKELRPDPSASPQALDQARQQFQREAGVLANLAHPNLPRVTDYFSWGGNEYLVMDFVAGESLAALIQRHGRLPEAEVLRWADALLDTLAYLHSRGILHRDVKPGNIIITPQGQPVLVDFGLVKLWNLHDPRTVIIVRGMGTPAYTPLEQYASGPGHTDARSDIYSLGATLYHALTGQPPADVPQRSLNPLALPAPRALNPALTPQTETAVLKALAIQPPDRFQSATEMRAALRPAAGPLVHAPRWGVAPAYMREREPATIPTGPPRRRRKTGVVIGGAMGLLILGACLAGLAGIWGLARVETPPTPTATPWIVMVTATSSPQPTVWPTSTAIPEPTSAPTVPLPAPTPTRKPTPRPRPPTDTPRPTVVPPSPTPPPPPPPPPPLPTDTPRRPTGPTPTWTPAPP